MQAVILAAGKGTRLHPITLKRSKAMTPIAGKPMVSRVIETFLEVGIRKFILVISPTDQEIVHYFNTNSRPDLEFQLVMQPERLGMANALSLVAPYLHDTFLLSACDSIVPVEHLRALLATHQARQANATLSLMKLPPERISRSGIVELNRGEITRIVEKPSPAETPSDIGSLPLYIFTPKLLDYLPEVKLSPRGEYELQDAIQMLIERAGQVTGVLTDKRVQLTNADDLLFLNRFYLNQLKQPGNGSNGQLHRQVSGAETQLITPLHIETGATIGPGCTIGPHVYIERDCHIGANVVIKDAVILRDAVIADGQEVVGEVIV